MEPMSFLFRSKSDFEEALSAVQASLAKPELWDVNLPYYRLIMMILNELQMKSTVEGATNYTDATF